MKKNPGCLILINVWLIAAAICFAVFTAINKTGQSVRTILFFSILLGAMIGFVAFCIMMIIGTTKIKKAKKYQAKQTETINLANLSENHTISEKVSFDKPVEAYAASYVSEQQKKDALRIYNDSIDIIMKKSNME